MRCVLLVTALGAFAARGLAQSPDTSLYTPVREIRVGVSTVALKRAVSAAGFNPSYSNANLRAIEAFTMGAQGGGVRIRYETGTIEEGGPLSTGTFESIGANLLLGREEFALVLGYRLLKMTWTEERRFATPEVGLEGGRLFAGAGILVKGGVTYRMTPGEAKQDSVKMSGLEARTSVLYVPPRLPLYVELGYRRDVLAFKHPDNGIVRREEVSAVILSIGLQTGLSVR